MMNPYAGVCTKTRNNRKTLRKTQKNDLLKTKRMPNTEIQVNWGSVFTFSLPGGTVRTLAPLSVTPLAKPDESRGAGTKNDGCE